MKNSRAPFKTFAKVSGHSPFRVSDKAALGTGSELLFLVLEQDVECRERSVTARDVLLQLDLIGFAQFVARVHLLLENSQIITNHHDFVEERLERDFFRLKRTVRGLHKQRPLLPSSR